MNENNNSNIAKTPSFSYSNGMVTAPLWRRLASMCYDSLLMLALLIFATSLILPLNQGHAYQPHHWLYRSYLFTLISLFYIGFWMYGGQTLGMRAWRIRVCSIAGHSLTLKQAFFRYLLAIPSILFVGIGFWWALLDSQGDTCYDRWSRSKVILTE
jgi:uncharacterized RDD family membrane protein YckC